MDLMNPVLRAGAVEAGPTLFDPEPPQSGRDLIDPDELVDGARDRLCRGITLMIGSKSHIIAAQALGAETGWILLRTTLSN